MALDPASAFSGLPTTLVADLLEAYAEVIKNYREQRWEPSELNGGKLCEAVFTICDGFLGNSYAPRARKPANMVAACRELETKYPNGPRSPRIQIPRMVLALYEIRNNRGVGHAGGDVNPNHMDATAVLYMSKWLVAELLRLLHGLSTDEAAEIVDLLVERETPLLWKNGSIRRVLRPGLPRRSQVLLLLSDIPAATDADLANWMEEVSLPYFRRDVIRRMHKERLIEYDAKSGLIRLLPPGVEAVDHLVRDLLTK